jgi:hypothetical protein
METQEALNLLHIDCDLEELGKEQLRSHYRRLALRTHPDKNPGDAAAPERFKQLLAAYQTLIQRITVVPATDQRGHLDGHDSSSLAEVLERALQGEDVEHHLRRLNVHRPPAGFGVEKGVRFDARLQPHAGHGHADIVDLNQLFKEILESEELEERANSISGSTSERQDFIDR